MAVFNESEFTDGDITYAIDFRITKIELKGLIEGFDAMAKDRQSYTGNKIHKTKNEAIDAMINQLKELKE